MKITVGGHEVEGTAEEVAKLLALMSGGVGSPRSEVAPVRKAVALVDGASPFVSEDLAFAVLTRRELGETHVKMLRKLDEADDKWTTAPELQRALDLSTREFAGVLGAFGRRLSNTPGAGSRSFFDQYWDPENGYNLYRLPPSVRAALRKAKVV
ncbi:hypothetical protein [Sphingomonas sp. DC1600-2]|uniref:hypothetical protein n=1 Tax=unclassified Sphingomonas TaxID=196159 RepID=UPI003CF01AD2